MNKSHEPFNFIWSIANLLFDPYRPPRNEHIMLSLVVPRRFDCVLESTKPAVLAKVKEKDKPFGEARNGILNKVSGQQVHNHSQLSKVMGGAQTT